jgi:hypothetical protein
MTQLTQFQFEVPGASPFSLEGPVTAGTGQLGPQFKPGTTVALGDNGAEFIYCKLVLSGTTTLADGQLYTIDGTFSASLLTTTNSPRGQSVVVGRVNQANVAAGTYYFWVQRAGNAPVVMSGSANALAETTATGGKANFTNSPTVGSKLIVGLYVFNASPTFTANTKNGSPTLTGISSLDEVALGAGVAGTGIPGSTTVIGIDRVNGTITMSANASADGTGITVTLSGTVAANVMWPYIDKTN